MSSRYKISKRLGTNNYQVRYKVLEKHRPALGGTPEIWRSLGTPVLSEAKERAEAVANDILLYILTLQPVAPTPDPVQPDEPTHAEIENAAREVYAIEVGNDQEERADPEHMELFSMGGKRDAQSWKREAKRLRQAISSGDFSVGDFDYWEVHFDFHFRPNSPKERLFKQLLARAYAEAAQRFSEHAQGNFAGKPSDALLRPSVTLSGDLAAHPNPPPAPPPAVTFKQPPLLDHWDTYVRQRGTGITGDTITSRQQAVEMFAQFIGVSQPTDSVTKDKCREFRDLLYDLPKNASMRRVFAGMSISEIVQANKRHRFDTITASRVKHVISHLSVFFDWLSAEGRIEGNYWQGLAPKVEIKSRVPFSHEHLQTFFNSPLFTGCANDGSPSKVSAPGDVLIRDWRFWLPLIAAFSGARLGEIAQLELSDIKTIDGIECFEITNQGRDKSVKSHAAVRTVPIHSQLIKLGILGFAQKQHKAGETKLFPELARNTKGQFGEASKFYQRYLERLNLKPDSEGKIPTFHSFRHSVIDAFRRADLYEREVQPIVGHEHKSVTRGYGREATYSVKKRKQIIEAINYPGLDLSNLIPLSASNTTKG